MKEIYVSAEIEIVKFEAKDVITTSSFSDSSFEGEEDMFW